MKLALLFLAVSLLTWGCRERVDRAFIYFPVRELAGTPASLGLAYQDVWFQADDGVRLHGWLIPGTRPTTLLWSHGNAGNISHRLDN
ncbi:MAG: alpha/beta hydrolase, partial [candidate division NC10 bacterium]